MASAMAWARGTRVSTSRYSSGVCALAPTGPTPHSVGQPTADVKPEIGAAARELAGDLQAGIGRRRLVAAEQLLGRGRG